MVHYFEYIPSFQCPYSGTHPTNAAAHQDTPILKISFRALRILRGKMKIAGKKVIT